MSDTDKEATARPPRWDMTVVYPALSSPEFAAGFARTVKTVDDLSARFDAEGINGAPGAVSLGEDAVRRFELACEGLNAALEEMRTLRAYIHAFVATDSRDETAQARLSELRRTGVTLSLLHTRFTAWIGRLDVDALRARSRIAEQHAFFLREAKVASEHLMAPGEEDLAAELNLAGGAAWSRLYGDVTSQTVVPFTRIAGGTAEDLPMSVIRGLATDPDREVRRRAYEAELAAWGKTALPLAAALNAIKHEANALATRRGWATPLDQALFNNRIDRQTLDSLFCAARESFPDFRRYLRAKARLVAGAERLPWFDLFAPVGDQSGRWEWGKAEAFVAEQFGTYSEELRRFAERTFRERWIDAAPRAGKRDGAFCMGLRGDESRIAQNYRPSFDGVSTLAHELGHAYHNLCLAARTPLQRSTPMTLAETASIFCETIIREAALEHADNRERLTILEASLQGTCQVVVDITSRFLFEQRVLEARRRRELSVPELCDLMRGAQAETYGDGLDAPFLHPYMWAAKPHYYGSTFYNFPYMFGLLFGLGLFARYRESPAAFRDRYDALLAGTGLADAADLAEGFGIDLRTETFWRSSLDIIRNDIARFEALTIKE
jgi:pepF/M3 family oligoendopeptidase